MAELNFKFLKPGAHVHFIGVGGISMSGLAELMIKNGYIVSGSDIRQSQLVNRLKRLGVNFYLGHNANNIKNADLVIYTAAVKNSNPEIIEAKKLNIPIIERAVLVGELMKKYKKAIAIAGTHGKTTTTSMVSLILMHANTDPTILVGGQLDDIGGNVRVGKSTYFVTEACEYVDSFLKFYPYIGVILNVEMDHLDYFKDLDDIIDSFCKFGNLIPKDGYAIINADNSNAVKIIDNLNCNILTFGLKSTLCDIKAQNIAYNNYGFPHFDIMYKNKKIMDVQLNVPGIHNIYNSLAAAACTYCSGIEPKYIKQALSSFKGTHRRFETKGKINELTVVDDYAHHPTEIKTTLSTAKKICSNNNLWCIFQPHTYSRTLALLNEFSESFKDADKIIITDIYAAREKDKGKIHSKDLVNLLKQKNYDAIYISNFDKIASYVLDNASKGDMIITMGAGNITELSNKILSSNI